LGEGNEIMATPPVWSNMTAAVDIIQDIVANAPLRFGNAV